MARRAHAHAHRGGLRARAGAGRAARRRAGGGRRRRSRRRASRSRAGPRRPRPRRRARPTPAAASRAGRVSRLPQPGGEAPEPQPERWRRSRAERGAQPLRRGRPWPPAAAAAAARVGADGLRMAAVDAPELQARAATTAARWTAARRWSGCARARATRCTWTCGIGAQAAPLVGRRMTSDGELSERRPDAAPLRRGNARAVPRAAPAAPSSSTASACCCPTASELPRLPGMQDTASQFVQLTWLFTTQPQLLQVGPAHRAAAGAAAQRGPLDLRRDRAR